MTRAARFAMTRFEVGDTSDLPLSRWEWTFVYGYQAGRRWRRQCLMPLKKPSVSSEPKLGGTINAVTGSWGKTYPTVCEFLSVSVWEDGSSRELGKLTLFWDETDGRWKVFLNCIQTSRTACVSGEDPEGVLKAAEKALASDRADFRPWKKPKARKGG